MSSRSRTRSSFRLSSSKKAAKPTAGMRWSRDHKRVIITKGPGETHHIALDDITNRLHRLKPYHDIPVKELPADVNKDFQILTEQISMIYDTEAYATVYGQMEAIYGSLGQNLVPGSIGAYIIGCAVASKRSSHAGCDILCAGSAPTPNGASDLPSSFLFCGEMVLLAIKDEKSGVHNFTQLNQVDEKDCANAVIYVQSNGRPFEGLSQEEINALQNYPSNSSTHIQNVKIVGYDPSTKAVTPITNDTTNTLGAPQGFVPLNNMPSGLVRPDASTLSTPSTTGYGAGAVATVPTSLGKSVSSGASNGWNLGLIILLVILILIAIFVGIQCYKGRKVVVVPSSV